MDMTETIAPRSDQMNAEDLLSGPRTFTVTEVRQGASPEQPVNIYLAEFPADRPFKPSKTVRRILVGAWGADTAVYVGRRMTLYRDPAVKFGGMDVGGIRISHLSHIEKRMTLALTVTRGKRAPYVVEPLPDVAPAVQRITPDHERVIGEHMKRTALSGSDVLDAARKSSGRAITTARDLTASEADALIAYLAELPDEYGPLDAAEDDPNFPAEGGAA